MNKILAFSIVINNKAYKVRNNKNGITSLDKAIKTLKETNNNIDIIENGTITFIRYNDIDICYNLNNGKVRYILFNKKYANNLILIGKNNTTYIMQDLLTKMKFLDIKKMDNTYFSNIEILNNAKEHISLYGITRDYLVRFNNG